METIINNKGAVILSEKDILIVEYFSRGLNSKRVGKKVDFSPRTVESKILTLRKKYKCKNITHLVATFFRSGILPYEKGLHDVRKPVIKK